MLISVGRGLTMGEDIFVRSYPEQAKNIDLPIINAGGTDNTINDRLVISKFNPLSSLIMPKVIKYLAYTGFPVTKRDLCSFANQYGAEPEVINKLKSLRRTLYENYTQLLNEMI